MKRQYTDHDVKVLKQQRQRWTAKKFGPTDNYCTCVEKFKGAKGKRISNPLYKVKKKHRSEPRTMKPHQIGFIVEHKYAPVHPHSLSHICGRSNCTKNGHLLPESLKVNNSRKRCHNELIINGKKQYKSQELSGKNKLTLSSCKHIPPCFYNMGC